MAEAQSSAATRAGIRNRAVQEAYETVKADRYVDVPLIHKVDTLALPMRLVTEEEYAFSKA